MSFSRMGILMLWGGLFFPFLSAQENVNLWERHEPTQGERQKTSSSETYLHSGEIITKALPGEKTLREENLAGPYQQPRWTGHRRFPTTRVYLQQSPGEVGVEYWLIPEFQRHHQRTAVRQLFELEVGLPHRFQVDIYGISDQGGDKGKQSFDGGSLEFRYALADWGKIPANPTVYLELTQQKNGPDLIETKLLLGDQLGRGWHWGANLSLEHGMGGDQYFEHELTVGLSRTLVDERLSAGVEGQFAYTNTKHSRTHFERELFLGPSLQYYLSSRLHVDFAPLFGLTHDSPQAKLFFIAGWEF